MNTEDQKLGWKDNLNILKLIVPQLGFLLVWAVFLGGIFYFNGNSNREQELTVSDQRINKIEQKIAAFEAESKQSKTNNQSKNVNSSEEIKQLKLQIGKLQQLEDQLKSQSEKLDANKEGLKAQLDEMKSANDKLSDLVIATLGTVVTIAFAIPALAVISQVIANKETIDKIQTRVKQNVANELNKFSDNLSLNYLNDLGAYYESSTLSINQAVDKIREILECKNVQLDLNDSLAWIENLSENDIKKLDKDDFKKLKIYRYPLLLQDCIKVMKILQAMKKISELDFLGITDNKAVPIYIKRHLKIIQLPLVVMNQSQHISDKLYVAPKPMPSQIIELKKIIKEFKDDDESQSEVENIEKLLDSFKVGKTSIDFSRIVK